MMSSTTWKATFVASAWLVLAAFGCNSSAPPPTTAASSTKSDHDDHAHGAHGHSHGEGAHDHSGWWCAEHGVPEDICSQCSSKYAAECQKKGDWCEEHNRAKSQCFLCDPKLKEKFAAKYQAKFGKEPPAIEEEEKKDSKF
jgi:hypothetical protein